MSIEKFYFAPKREDAHLISMWFTDGYLTNIEMTYYAGLDWTGDYQETGRGNYSLPSPLSSVDPDFKNKFLAQIQSACESMNLKYNKTTIGVSSLNAVIRAPQFANVQLEATGDSSSVTDPTYPNYDNLMKSDYGYVIVLSDSMKQFLRDRYYQKLLTGFNKSRYGNPEAAQMYYALTKKSTSGLEKQEDVCNIVADLMIDKLTKNANTCGLRNYTGSSPMISVYLSSGYKDYPFYFQIPRKAVFDKPNDWAVIPKK